MYTDVSHISAAITEESIPLWEEHTAGYVDDVNQKLAAYVVQAKETCRAATAEFTANEEAAGTVNATLTSVAVVDAAVSTSRKGTRRASRAPDSGRAAGGVLCA